MGAKSIWLYRLCVSFIWCSGVPYILFYWAVEDNASTIHSGLN
uniref:Uncharacterized protein n=1 Tax=Anguilla anguilla TaxID=7936 RepID=A0A0E9VTA7_ANGAN